MIRHSSGVTGWIAGALLQVVEREAGRFGFEEPIGHGGIPPTIKCRSNVNVPTTMRVPIQLLPGKFIRSKIDILAEPCGVTC
jgi:hypothetical protein